MTVLILGLVVFLMTHSVRIVADDWRSAQIARRGEQVWKGLLSLASLAGFVLLVWGYGQARTEPVLLWAPPLWTRHLAALLMLPSFILLAAAYLPGNRLKARLHHPMVLGVKVWALAHLLANGNLADVVLFGSFLLWSVLDFRSARQRDARLRTVYAAGTPSGDLRVVLVGVVSWTLFTFWAHAWLIGVAPLG